MRIDRLVISFVLRFFPPLLDSIKHIKETIATSSKENNIFV